MGVRESGERKCPNGLMDLQDRLSRKVGTRGGSLKGDMGEQCSLESSGSSVAKIPSKARGYTEIYTVISK